MPEYVYALFDFVPENPDEINFKTGDRIEVIERDDVYGDGWWQVSPLSIGSTFSFDMETFFWSGSVFGGQQCTGGRRVVNIRRGVARSFSLSPPVSMRAHRNI